MTALLATVAGAQNATFDFNISASEAVLAEPNNPLIQHYEAWDSPLGRILKNSRPFIEVRNTSAMGSNVRLNEFRITVGDMDYQFSDAVLGAFAKLGMTTPNASISSTTTANGDELVVSFGNGGLAPDEFVRFQIDLDGDPGLGLTAHPDYRMVMFDLFENDNSDNSRLTANFTNTMTGAQLTATGVQQDLGLPPAALGQTIFTAGVVRPYSAMEGVEVNGFAPDPVIIPEPSTFVLGLIALLSGSAAAMRQRLG